MMRGIVCGCRGNCPEHDIVAQKRAKRKGFEELTAQAKRKTLKEIRELFKEKSVEYATPVSRLAGFVIQQASFHVLINDIW